MTFPEGELQQDSSAPVWQIQPESAFLYGVDTVRVYDRPAWLTELLIDSLIIESKTLRSESGIDPGDLPIHFIFANGRRFPGSRVVTEVEQGTRISLSIGAAAYDKEHNFWITVHPDNAEELVTIHGSKGVNFSHRLAPIGVQLESTIWEETAHVIDAYSVPLIDRENYVLKNETRGLSYEEYRSLRTEILADIAVRHKLNTKYPGQYHWIGKRVICI